MEINQIIKLPLITERSTQLKEKENKYVFMVAKNANKFQIKEAVEKLFDVDVIKVNTFVVKGKLRRLSRYQGYRPDWKKAIVKLKPGQEIKIVEESK